LKKVCLITPGHISTNPRLVKEATALSQNKYKVHIIFTQYVTEQIQYDEEILNSNPDWSYNKLNWAGTTVSSKINRFIGKLHSLSPFNPSLKLNRNLLWQRAKACSVNADLYIAHNLGALPVAVYAAAKRKAKSGFDAEDFHRGENNADVNSPEVLLKTAIENKYIPKVDYFTTSSPEIAEAYCKIYSFLKPDVLLNVFPTENLNEPHTPAPLQTKLIWFSQTIGPNRGLEDIINALNFLNNPAIELHLLGCISSSSRPVLQLIEQTKLPIVLHKILAPDQLINFCSQFDIGLALEPGFSANNNMALSNKLFTYMQAGITTIASNTLAQKKLLDQHPAAGHIYQIGNYKALAEIILFYHTNRPELSKAKNIALQLARNKLNWEIESGKFLRVVNDVLKEQV
jgi:glycosyltransferase involved in cell wall biosynthesis